MPHCAASLCLEQSWRGAARGAARKGCAQAPAAEGPAAAATASAGAAAAVCGPPGGIPADVHLLSVVSADMSVSIPADGQLLSVIPADGSGSIPADGQLLVVTPADGSVRHPCRQAAHVSHSCRQVSSASLQMGGSGWSPLQTGQFGTPADRHLLSSRAPGGQQPQADRHLLSSRACGPQRPHDLSQHLQKTAGRGLETTTQPASNVHYKVPALQRGSTSERGLAHGTGPPLLTTEATHQAAGIHSFCCNLVLWQSEWRMSLMAYVLHSLW